MLRPALALCVLGLLAGPALAQQGLTLKPDASALSERSLRFGELQIDLAVADWGSTQRARLFGDYYLTGPGFGEGRVAGGLRLTSGLSIGPRSATLAVPPSRTGEGLHLGPRAVGITLGDAERVTLPYLGVGYTGLALRGGWAFSADVGLGGLRPGERVRYGSNRANATQVESLLNDLRLAPVIQFGVSYAF